MKLAVLTCFYSFSAYKRPVQNLHRFLRQMQRDGAAVFGVEAVSPRRPKHTNTYKNWRQVDIDPATQTLWHKEALLNLAEKMVPEEYDAVAWIDADVWFSNPNWIADTEQLLEETEIVQLFEKAKWTSETGTVELIRDSVGKTPLSNSWKSHPGFAWAMRRSVWREMGGLYPFALSGGGDSVMTLAFQNSKLWPMFEAHVGPNKTFYEEWAAKAANRMLGFVPGDCYHEWHGTWKDRDYVGRAKRVAQIVVGEHITLGSNGLPQWTPKASPELVKSVADYFIKRNEDGNE